MGDLPFIPYRLVIGLSARDLEERVNHLLAKGWRLYGSVCFADTEKSGQMYIQSVLWNYPDDALPAVED